MKKEYAGVPHALLEKKKVRAGVIIRFVNNSERQVGRFLTNLKAASTRSDPRVSTGVRRYRGTSLI